MPRQKISEYRSKKIITEALGLSYAGWEVGSNFSADLVKGFDSYVVKVDQAVKGRYKKGLVLLDVKEDEIAASIDSLRRKGYEYFIIEPYFSHTSQDERYLSLLRDRKGYFLSYSRIGGVDVESHSEAVHTVLLNDATDWSALGAEMGIAKAQLQTLLSTFIENHFTFLEINPYTVVDSTEISILDAAVEVDDAASHFTQGWTESDIRRPGLVATMPSEKTVLELDAKSPASFNLSVLNPNGSIFLLLSGGGASVVIADEVFNRGFGDMLANYGEYSGNPTAHETYVYTAEILKLVLASSAKKKIVFIGGAVANFTDIASTFTGVIKAFSEFTGQLQKSNVRVYVRRGGPRQEIGLAKIRAALEEYDLYGGVYDPTTSITGALDVALKEVERV
jgi:succinyl-CoA synthetase beta subunit